MPSLLLSRDCPQLLPAVTHFPPDEHQQPTSTLSPPEEEGQTTEAGLLAEDTVLSSLRELDALVDELLASWMGPVCLPRRRFHRISYRRPLALTPLCDATLQAAGRTCRVEARDLSRAGLSFQHCHPLESRLVAVTFPEASESVQTIVMRLTWCRFTRYGVYYSGGRFLRRRNFGWEDHLDCSSLPLG